MILLELVINFLVAALLVVTILYCRVLNKRIMVLQDSKSELAALLAQFDESTNRASESIMALQTASKKIGEVMQRRIEKANYVANDLSFLIDKASRMTQAKPSHSPEIEEAELAIRKARAVTAAEKPEPRERKDKDAGRGGISALHSMIEKIAARTTDAPRAKAAAAERAQASRAEKELLEFIRTGNKV